MPDAVAARSSRHELAGVMRLVTAAVVKSEANEALIGAVHALPIEHQVVLMQVIEQVLEDMDIHQRDSHAAAAAAEIESLRREVRRLGNVVSEHQDQLSAAEHHIEQLLEENKRLGSVTTMLRTTEQERDSMRDQLDEWRHIIETSESRDNALAKYKRSAEELGDMRRQIRALEQKNATLERESMMHKDVRVAEEQDSAAVQQRSMRQLEQLCAELDQRLQHEREENARLAQELERSRGEHAASKAQTEQLLERVHALEIGDGRSSAVSDVQGEEPEGEKETRAPAALLPELEQALPTADDTLASLSAVLAELTALRNNARSREHEAQSQLHQYSKRYTKKQAPKEIRTVLGLLGEASQRDEHVFRRLHTCWKQAQQLASSAAEAPAAPSAALLAVQRERDALRTEQRLMASAFHMLSERLYGETDWARHKKNAVDIGVAGGASASFREGGKPMSTWLGEQRSALTGTLFSRK